MNMASSGYPAGDMRVSDAERDVAVGELSEHFQSGRLDEDEFDDRSGRALRAKTGNDLNELFTDLPPRPVAGLAPAPVPVPSTSTSPARRPSSTRRIVLNFLAVIIAADIIFGSPAEHHALGWLIPLFLFVLIFVRRCARR